MAGPSCILTYHSLDDSGSVISTPPALFERQMSLLASSGIPVVPLDEALRRSGCCAITFDDAFQNVVERALPILDRYRFPATVFAVSGFCGGLNNWPSQPSGAVPVLPLMSWGDLRRLPPAISIGAHTATHPFLTRLPASECDSEMASSKNEIEQRLGRPVRWFAYPYGDFSPQVRSLAAAHFELAVSTSLRFLPTRCDPLALPRIDSFYLRGHFPMGRLFQPSGAIYIGLRRALREVRRLTASARSSRFRAPRS